MKVTDQAVNGTSGRATFLRGGPGYKFVEIGIDGIEGYDVFYKVLIHGRYPVDLTISDNHV